jgi:phosphatidylserine/phosphatidylglycerophosphate/cardiolipin synthase-like enzyme
MRYCLSAVFFCSALLFLGAGDASPRTEPQISVHFSPSGGCTASVVNAVGDAKETVFVQAYVLTSDPIAQSLAAAKRRGVDVRVLLDDQGAKSKGSDMLWLLSQGVPCLLDKAHEIAHNKTIIIDGRTVVTGSFNFTAQAESRNAENLLIIQDERIAKTYAANFLLHQKHSISPYIGKEATATPSTSTSTNRPNPCANGQCRTPATLSRSRRR